MSPSFRSLVGRSVGRLFSRLVVWMVGRFVCQDFQKRYTFRAPFGAIVRKKYIYQMCLYIGFYGHSHTRNAHFHTCKCISISKYCNLICNLILLEDHLARNAMQSSTGQDSLLRYAFTCTLYIMKKLSAITNLFPVSRCPIAHIANNRVFPYFCIICMCAKSA